MKKNKAFHLGLAILFYGLLLSFIILAYPGRSNFRIEAVFGYSNILFKGYVNTIIVSIVVLILSIILGFILYLLSNSKILAFKYISNIFSEVIFGTPTIVFLIVTYYFIAAPLNLSNRFLAGIIGFSLFMGPYMRNAFIGAIKSIDDTQYQAMKVLGFTSYQKYRYIILPQLVKVIVPPMIGNLAIIIKGSSLLNFIGVEELYNQITTIQSRTYAVVEGYLVMFLLYLSITLPLIFLAKYFEKKVTSWI
ncbi:MAG: amino acid ABC transporter permease [Acholeplasmataceae bacterium]|jgi:polar amino acid transport system permease protein|nr:amino acid ABC transporter permease [Acholeplasmataceae bacterium]